MSKANNQFGIDFAYPGLCSLCHTEIAEFDGSNSYGRPIITKLKPTYREATVQLNDSSKMKVALCESCFETFSAEDAQELMESEINGWQNEIDTCCNGWLEDKRLNYMKEFSKKEIVSRSDRPWTLGEIARIKKPRPEKLRVKVSK